MAKRNSSLYKIYFCCFACVILHVSSFGQTTKKLEILAKKAFESGDYSSASVYFQTLFERDTNNISNAHFLAMSCFNIYQLDKAQKYFSVVIRNDLKKNYKRESLLYAQTLKMCGNYKRAKKEFEKYLRRIKKSSPDEIKAIEKEIQGCAMALQIKSEKSTLIQKLSNEVNTDDAEIAPFLHKKYLYFSSNEDSGLFRLYRITYPDIKGRSQISITPNNNFNTQYSNLCISHDRVFFTKTQTLNGEKNTSIFSSYLKDTLQEYNSNRISSPINLENSVSTQPCVMIQGNSSYLIFASNHAGSLGGFDLYMSKFDGDQFENPVSISSQINSLGDEVTPFYCETCKALFFSSNFYAGFGAFDIFKSKFVDGKFQEPINLGVNFNSSLNDLYYTENHTEGVGFLSSNRKGNVETNHQFCCNDIYSFTISKDSIVQPDTSKIIRVDTLFEARKYMDDLLPLSLYFDNDEPNPKSMQTNTDADYPSTVGAYVQKQKTFVKKYSEGLSKDEAEDAELEMNAFFTDSIKGNSERLNVLLLKLRKLLEQGYKAKILLKGYTSSIASNEYNKNLAKRRVKSLMNYINQYSSGCLKGFISNGNLEFQLLEIGEDESQEISDNLNDLKNSVYSLKASYSRKISILKIKLEL